MKIIDLNVLEDVEKAKPALILKEVLQNSPQKQLSVDDMRRRIHVMDVLEKCKSGLFKIEDSDHATLSEALKTYPWSRAVPSLLALIDAVLEAKAPTDEPEVAQDRAANTKARG